LQSQIYDLKTETTDAGAQAEGPCTVIGIKASIDQVVAKFKGGVVVPDQVRGLLVASSSYSGGSVCEGNLKLDGNC